MAEAEGGRASGAGPAESGLVIDAVLLDSRFRRGSNFLAQGPFMIFDADMKGQWSWGFDLRAVGSSLHFYDGTALGRGYSADQHFAELSDDGSFISIYARKMLDQPELTLVAPSPSLLRQLTDGVRSADLDEVGAIARNLMHAERWKLFGIRPPLRPIIRMGLVFQAAKGVPVEGLYEFPREGVCFKRRVPGSWVDVEPGTEPWSSGEKEFMWMPALRSTVRAFDHWTLRRSDPPSVNRFKRHAQRGPLIQTVDDWVVQLRRGYWAEKRGE
ncbi:hypothetical protein ACUXNS_002391 [Brevibacterium pityocampae]